MASLPMANAFPHWYDSPPIFQAFCCSNIFQSPSNSNPFEDHVEFESKGNLKLPVQFCDSVMETKRSLSLNEYTVGWIAALSIELGVASVMLDEEHEKPSDFIKPLTDQNTYTWGKIHKHNVVIASLPTGIPGKVSATATALSMLSSFPQIRIGLLVGIGAGVPRLPERDIRLGDVVVSKPNGRDGGVVQHDSFKAKSGGEVESRHFLNSPPRVLLGALSKLQGRHEYQEPKFPGILSDTLKRHPRLKKRGYVYQGREKDKLYKITNSNEEIERETRDSDNPEVYYGTIASGDTLFKDAAYRDKVLSRLGDDCICIEMEAAGLMNDFPCIVIRGISDYADSHKNDVWQRYAAATAAAYAKELLYDVDCQELQQTLRACDLENISEQLTEISSNTKAISATIESMQKDSESERIRGWLNPPDPSTNLNEARKKRLSGTGSWLLETELFRQWKSGSRQYLWLHGIPGCGKTVLSSTIIDHLDQESDGFVVLNFFFDFNDSKKQSLENLVRSLVIQLYSKCKNSRAELEALEKSCGIHQQQPAFESLFGVFLEMVNSAGKVQIVIDALDECEKREDLLSWIESFTSSSPKELRLLLTSRKEQDIESQLMFWLDPESVVPIQQDSVNPDIRAYVRDRLQRDRGFARWNAQPSVRDEIEAELMENADGMFRWAACQLDILRNCRDYPNLQKALASLPATLEETYARMLANIQDIDREKAIRILQFLTYSERPLTLEEAMDVLVVYPDKEPTFYPKWRMPIPLEIQLVCSSLISLVTRETYSGQAITELQLAHSSVQQYLKSKRIGPSFPNEMAEVGTIFQNGMAEVVARGSITKVCLAYLSHLGKEIAICADRNLLTRIERDYKLVEFATRYWMDHAKAAEPERDVLKIILNFFLHQQQGCHLWTQMFEAYKHRTRPFDPIQTVPPLYYASFAGLKHTAGYMLANGVDINSSGGHYQSAFHAAAAQNQKDIVQLLLDNGADINAEAPDEYALWLKTRPGLKLKAETETWTALSLASRYGHLEMVQLLLANGASIKTDQGHCPAFLAASRGGHTKIAQLLLDNGASFDMQDEGYYNLLRDLSNRGSKEILQLLLPTTGDINAQHVNKGDALRDALFTACLHGYRETVELLLDTGADVNLLAGAHGTALAAAASTGQTAVVRLLLERGADVNLLAGDRGTALEAAACQGSIETVRLLLDKGADVNLIGGDRGTALAAAASHGHTEIVQLLLGKGADYNLLDCDRGTALTAAASEGHAEIVQLLLDKGADVNIPGGYPGTALQGAVVSGHSETVRLLQNRANVDTFVGKQPIPRIALESRPPKIVR
ncbi:hypothetical protein FQN55_007023 [Onygenales sp. PD_40]|nr:hypothetical protein FQN55_007023 [Onygenales sp. PD_40]